MCNAHAVSLQTNATASKATTAGPKEKDLYKYLHELVCQFAPQLFDDHCHTRPLTPHQQVLLCAGVRKVEVAGACCATSMDNTGIDTRQPWWRW